MRGPGDEHSAKCTIAISLDGGSSGIQAKETTRGAVSITAHSGIDISGVMIDAVAIARSELQSVEVVGANTRIVGVKLDKGETWTPSFELPALIGPSRARVAAGHGALTPSFELPALIGPPSFAGRIVEVSWWVRAAVSVHGGEWYEQSSPITVLDNTRGHDLAVNEAPAEQEGLLRHGVAITLGFAIGSVVLAAALVAAARSPEGHDLAEAATVAALIAVVMLMIIGSLMAPRIARRMVGGVESSCEGAAVAGGRLVLQLRQAPRSLRFPARGTAVLRVHEEATRRRKEVVDRIERLLCEIRRPLVFEIHGGRPTLRSEFALPSNPLPLPFDFCRVACRWSIEVTAPLGMGLRYRTTIPLMLRADAEVDEEKAHDTSSG